MKKALGRRIFATPKELLAFDRQAGCRQPPAAIEKAWSFTKTCFKPRKRKETIQDVVIFLDTYRTLSGSLARLRIWLRLVNSIFHQCGDFPM
jgi:hypothetical protein